MPVPALAESALPTFDGEMVFPAIQGPLDPEEFSWEVDLDEDQELQLIDSQHAVVYYAQDQHPAFGIAATSAHDVSGATVPTDLAVLDGNVLTLTVHHRAGNPAAGRAPFDYPIQAGEGWVEVGPGIVVVMPLPEGELQEATERIERESRPTAVRDRGRPSVHCRVPRLKARSLQVSMRRIKEANCRVGRIGKRRGATMETGRVVRQNPRAGKVLVKGATVNLTLGLRK
jgi:hypothetical protein